MVSKFKNIARIYVFLAAVILLGNCQISSQGSDASSLQEAAQSIAAGNLERAENELQSILRISPDDYRALDFLGMVRAQQHRENEAELLFQNALRRKPAFPGGHVHLGLLYLQMNREQDAIVQLQEALRLAPDRTDAAAALVRIWREQASTAVNGGDTERALSVLIQARQLAPDDPEVQFEFGMAALRMALLPDAVEAFQQALKLRTDYAGALYGLGRAFMDLTKFGDARQQFARYVELRPDDASGHYALGMTLAALEHSQEARREFEKSVAIAPVQTESYFRLGVLDLDSKDLDSAAKNFHHVLDRDAKHAGALSALGRVEFERKKYPGAADLLQRAIASDDSLREAHYYLGLTYARMGRKEDADRQLQTATRIEHEQTQSQRTVFKIADPGSAGASEIQQK